MLVDLSDTNRPTNLADRFSELYDNEWTQALEDLNTVRKDDEVGNVNLLADILEVSIRSNFAQFINGSKYEIDIILLVKNTGTFFMSNLSEFFLKILDVLLIKLNMNSQSRFIREYSNYRYFVDTFFLKEGPKD